MKKRTRAGFTLNLSDDAAQSIRISDTDIRVYV
jgi:hypothetical protein